MWYMSVTELVFHLSRAWLKALALRNLASERRAERAWA